MTVREQLVLLSRLGQKDLQLKDLREKQKNLPQKANEVKNQALDASIQEETLKNQNTQLELRKKQIDLEIQTEKGNLRKWEARADKIKGEREYTTLMSEIGSQKKAISNLETKAFEVFEEQDKLKKNLEAAKEKLSKANALYQEEWTKVEGDVKALEAELQEAEHSRLELTQNIPLPLFKRYEQIALKRAGIGVAFLAKDICQACKRMLPPELCNRIAKGELIESCPACHRLLVTDNIGA